MNKQLAPALPPISEILALIQRECGILAGPIETLRSGAWSAALAFPTEDAEYVMRFAKTADDFTCDLNASQFSAENLPIPNVHGIGQLGDHWWCISNRMPGIHLDELSPEEFALVLPSIADMLNAMRNTDASSTSGYGGWDERGNGIFASFADQLLDVAADNPSERGGGWSEVLSQNSWELDVFQRGMIELESLCRFIPNTRQLIHQDTINYNVTVVDNRISGIFDWGCAMWGDALYDLAWFRFWDPWYPQRQHLHIPDRLEQLVGIEGANRDERMRCYLLHIGLMHIRYNAFIGDLNGMNDVAKETGKLLREIE